MANDFSGDSNCVALWRFESGALTTDSKGSNTLMDNNTVGTSTGDYKEGSACADLESGNQEFLSITDENLDADFPLKNGTSNPSISVCFWCKPESLSSDCRIFDKWDSGASKRSFLIRVTDTEFTFSIGISSGSSYETIYAGGSPVTGRWYHIGATFNDSTKEWQFVVWDDTASSKIINESGIATNNINIENATLVIGNTYNNDAPGSAYFDGLIDEVVVFKDILATGEIDEIRAGTYSESGNVSIPLSTQSLSLTQHALARVGYWVDTTIPLSTQSLSLTQNALTVKSDCNLALSTQALSLTQHNPTIYADCNLALSLVSTLTLAIQAASTSQVTTAKLGRFNFMGKRASASFTGKRAGASYTGKRARATFYVEEQ